MTKSVLLRPGRPRSSSSGFPLGRGEGAEEKARRGARTMRARSLRHRMCRQRTSVAPSRRRWADARRQRPRGCLSLWLLSLGQARESDPFARMANGKTHGRESVIATTQQQQTKRNSGRLKPTLRNWHAGRVTRPQRWRTEQHRDVSRSSHQLNSNKHHTVVSRFSCQRRRSKKQKDKRHSAKPTSPNDNSPRRDCRSSHFAPRNSSAC